MAVQRVGEPIVGVTDQFLDALSAWYKAKSLSAAKQLKSRAEVFVGRFPEQKNAVEALLFTEGILDHAS